MREIKFRAWEAGKMHYNGFVIHADGATEYPQGGWDCSGHDDKINIMQYTGLKDINGKDIYEGDIIQDIKHDIKMRTFIVEDIRTITREFDNSEHNSEWEIIGNIHENPELLED